MKKYLKLMRVHHYLKNILIFLPIVFSKNLFNDNLLFKSILGFISFSILSSIVYIINDIEDIEKDRRHPKKCTRPLAAGEISISSAYMLVITILVIGIILNFIVCWSNIKGWILITLYLGLNFAYSKGLKNIPIIDLAILVSGFFIRVLYGSAITGIEVSKWLYLIIISMSFYLGLGKRRNELGKEGAVTRKVLSYYNHNFLDKNMYMFLGLTIMFYSLWCVDEITLIRYSDKQIIWTVPIVMIICMKYSLNIEGDSDGDPVNVLLGDKVLIMLVLMYIFIMLAIIYL